MASPRLLQEWMTDDGIGVLYATSAGTNLNGQIYFSKNFDIYRTNALLRMQSIAGVGGLTSG
jgi:hypothetical protein